MFSPRNLETSIIIYRGTNTFNSILHFHIQTHCLKTTEFEIIYYLNELQSYPLLGWNLFYSSGVQIYFSGSQNFVSVVTLFHIYSRQDTNIYQYVPIFLILTNRPSCLESIAVSNNRTSHNYSLWLTIVHVFSHCEWERFRLYWSRSIKWTQ